MVWPGPTVGFPKDTSVYVAICRICSCSIGTFLGPPVSPNYGEEGRLVCLSWSVGRRAESRVCRTSQNPCLQSGREKMMGGAPAGAGHAIPTPPETQS